MTIMTRFGVSALRGRTGRVRPVRLAARIAALLVVSALGMLTVASCGAGSADPAGTGTVAAVPLKGSLHERLPAEVRDRGSLRVVTDASYPPMESFAADGQTIVGFDADLAAAIGKVLGVEITLSSAGFTDLADIVARGGADLVMSAMTDTVQREKKLDFVNYFTAGTAIVVQRGNPLAISNIGDLCGRAVAAETGTTQEDLLARWQATCADPIDIQSRPTNDDALVLLRTGRAAAILIDLPPAELLTSDPATRAQYELATTTQYDPGFYGIGVAKDRAPLRDLVRDAVAQLMSDGTYRTLLDKWDVGPGAVDTVSINAAASISAAGGS